MKCEKCSNEATFHYQSNINGEKTETHLCADCAKTEGFGEILSYRPSSVFDSFFSEPFGSLMGSFFSEPFGSFMGRGLLAPTMTLPQIKVIVGDTDTSTKAEEKSADNVPEDAGEEVRSRRELMVLKHQLKTAVRAEEFEKAAELRDKIREIEKK